MICYFPSVLIVLLDIFAIWIRYFFLIYGDQWNRDEGPPPSEAYSRFVHSVRDNPRDLAHIVAHYDGAIAIFDPAIRHKTNQLSLRFRKSLMPGSRA